MSDLTVQEQFQCLNVLEYVSDLFTVAGKETFTQVEVLHILNIVANDQKIFHPDVVIAQQIANAAIDADI